MIVLLIFCFYNSKAADLTSTNLISFKVIKSKWSEKDISEVQTAATNGDATAQVYLAIHNLGGENQTNLEYAIEWCQTNANQGLAAAQDLLGWAYQNGKGVGKNDDLAEKWMREAANQGFGDSQYHLGLFLRNQQDTLDEKTANYEMSADWFKKASAQGNANAQFEIGELYNYGKLGEDQRSNCIPWYLKSAAQGNAEAQAELGKLKRLYPDSPLLKSVDIIGDLRQAGEAGNLEAQFELAKRYHIGNGVPKDSIESFKWMEKAAQHEVSPTTLTIDAHYLLGGMYERGEGVEKNLTNAWQLYLEAAVGGNKPEPFTRVGQMYETGEGVTQDDQQAAENYYQAAQFGFFPTSDDTARSKAIEGLFNLYVQGKGLPDDKAAIDQRLKKVKRTPILTAKGQFLIGEIYYQSNCVPEDIVEAAAWFQLASNQNYDDARKKLNQIELKMSLAQKDAAKCRFDDLNGRIEQAKNSYKQLENYRRENSW